MEPFFSIVIPALNEEKYIPNLLDALLRQSEKDFEIIVVDGKSSDNTIRVANSYSKLFSRVNIPVSIIVSDKPNVSQQRNIGSEAAQGSYLVFFDADIVIPNDFLASIKKAIDETRAPLLATWIDPENKTFIERIIFFVLNMLIEFGVRIHKPMLVGYDIIIQKNIFNQIGRFRNDIKIAEDQELAERAFKYGFRAYVLRKPTIIHSSRRYNKNGYVRTTLKYLKATLYILFKGPITKDVVDYPMGGKANEK